jgi:signal transduction histidine kinase
MRARVEALGGSVAIGATPDGFTVRAWLPLDRP